MSTKHSGAHFRADIARQAHRAIHTTFAKVVDRRDDSHPATKDWHDAIAAHHRAVIACYPRGFWEAYADLEQKPESSTGGRNQAAPASIETAILFLEEDGLFFRSGYIKAATIQRLKRQKLTPEQIDRLGAVVLAVVDSRNTWEFRAYRRLACRVATPALREGLEARLAHENPDVQRRARWVLAAMDQAASAHRLA